MLFGVSPKFNGYFVSFVNPKWSTLKVDDAERLDFVMNDGRKFHGDFKTFVNGNEATGFQADVNKEFISALAGATGFRLLARGFQLTSLSLRGSMNALAAVDACQVDLTQGARPIGSGNAYAPPAATAQAQQPQHLPRAQKPSRAPAVDPRVIMRRFFGGAGIPF